MTANAIIAGTFADLRSVKSRSVVVLHIEVPIERAADVVAMFGYPQPGEEVTVAVARLVTEQPKAQPTLPEGHRFNDMPRAKQAGILCGEPEFWRFLEERYDAVIRGDEKAKAATAASDVRDICGVQSRADLDASREAAEAWDELRDAYRAWQRDIAGQEQAEAQVAAYRR